MSSPITATVSGVYVIRTFGLGKTETNCVSQSVFPLVVRIFHNYLVCSGVFKQVTRIIPTKVTVVSPKFHNVFFKESGAMTVDVFWKNAESPAQVIPTEKEALTIRVVT